MDRGDIRIMPTGVYERTEEHKKTFFKKGHTLNINRKRSDETKKKISESRVKLWKDPKYRERQLQSRLGENHINWSGGNDLYWHDKAWELFGLSCCEECGMTNEEHINRKGSRLSMHNILDPKDYKIMKKEAWQTVCEYGCHQKLEQEDY